MTPLPEPAVAHVGRVLDGKYRLTGLIGTGASAYVFRARHGTKPGTMAVKLLKPGYLKRTQGVDRFFREARIISQLEHPAVVRLLDWGYDEDDAYMVMEHVRGEDLKELLAKAGGTLPAPRATQLAATLCDALSAAHELDIVHRDLKPSNIRVLPRIGKAADQIKILDFGVAKVVQSSGDTSDRTIPRKLTAPGMLIGTPKYMSPEQARGRPLDTRSDLYTVGVLLYEMLAGRVPIVAERIVDMAIRVAADPPTPITDLVPDVDDELGVTVMRCLAKSPDQRFQQPAALRDRLRLIGARLSSGW